MVFNSNLLKEKEVKKPISSFKPGQAFIWKTFSHDAEGICVFIERAEDGRNTFICLNNMKVYSNYEHDTKYTIISIDCIDLDYVYIREGVAIV